MGKTNRYHLSRGGDRAVNAALPGSAACMVSDGRTCDYVVRQTSAGRTKKVIIRLPKRAIARELFRYLTTTVTVPQVADLRRSVSGRQSCIERGTCRDDNLANACRDWLHGLTAEIVRPVFRHPIPSHDQGVERFHPSTTMIVLYATGGSAFAHSWEMSLRSPPNISRTPSSSLHRTASLASITTK